MSDSPATGSAPDDSDVDIDDPFDVPDDVQEEWEGDEDPGSGPAPSG